MSTLNRSEEDGAAWGTKKNSKIEVRLTLQPDKPKGEAANRDSGRLGHSGWLWRL